MLKKLSIIINPSAGKDESILSIINRTFLDTEIEWEVFVTKKKNDAYNFAKDLVGKTDLIVGYGGDGTIMEIARALFQQTTPLAIIPGGTANVMAKELGIPVDSALALELLKTENPIYKGVDMALINEDPFFLRVNFGALADMVKETDVSAKSSLGQLAYGITAFKQILGNNIENVKYTIEVDGKTFEEEGVALVINNAGNVGLEGISFLPEIDVADGLLDALVIKNTDFVSLIEMASTAILGTEIAPSLKKFSGKEFRISMSKPQSIIRDDVLKHYDNIFIKVVPKALNILVPSNV